MSRQSLGALGERLARRHLEDKGYHILEANFRSPYGEVDLVARHGEHLVFVEVRARRGRNFGTPEESMTPAKGQRLVATAQSYLEAHPHPSGLWRIDFVAVELSPQGKLLRIEIIENAVT